MGERVWRGAQEVRASRPAHAVGGFGIGEEGDLAHRCVREDLRAGRRRPHLGGDFVQVVFAAKAPAREREQHHEEKPDGGGKMGAQPGNGPRSRGGASDDFRKRTGREDREREGEAREETLAIAHERAGRREALQRATVCQEIRERIDDERTTGLFMAPPHDDEAEQAERVEDDVRIASEKERDETHGEFPKWKGFGAFASVAVEFACKLWSQSPVIA